MAVLSADLRPPHRGMDPETLDLQYSPSRRVSSLAAVTERFDRLGAEPDHLRRFAQRIADGALATRFDTLTKAWRIARAAQEQAA